MSKNETKRDKFVRIAEARTIKIIQMVRLLGNCSNKNVYDFTEVDVKKIFKAIEDEVSDARRRFDKKSSAASDVFSLK